MTKYEPYTRETVLAKLRKIRDQALDWMEELCETRTSRGTGAAIHLFEKTQAEIDKIKKRQAGFDENVIVVRFDD